MYFYYCYLNYFFTDITKKIVLTLDENNQDLREQLKAFCEEDYCRVKNKRE